MKLKTNDICAFCNTSNSLKPVTMNGTNELMYEDCYSDFVFNCEVCGDECSEELECEIVKDGARYTVCPKCFHEHENSREFASVLYWGCPACGSNEYSVMDESEKHSADKDVTLYACDEDHIFYEHNIFI